MKTVVVLGATALAAYLLWLAWQNKKGDCGCGGHDQEEVTAPISGSEMGNGGSRVTADVQTYETSPMKTFNRPDRLTIKTMWPTDGRQQFVRG